MPRSFLLARHHLGFLSATHFLLFVLALFSQLPTGLASLAKSHLEREKQSGNKTLQ